MESSAPREEVDYVTLYKTFLTRDSQLPLMCFDSRAGEIPRCRLPFPPDRSGFSWTSRLESAREDIPKAVFRFTRPKIHKRAYEQTNQNVTVLALEIPQKRGRGRPKKDSTVLVDAAALNRSSFPVKKNYKTETDLHTVENYELHGHGGADVDVQEIGIIRPERHYLRFNSIAKEGTCEYDLDNQDVEWLKLAKETWDEMNLLSEDVMEDVIEELEQGWNILTQPIRKLQQRKEAAMFPDEVPCEICGDCDTSNCNVIVLCDDCDLAVHQECYGVPHIPEGPWLCRPCQEKNSVGNFKANCMLCPWPGGALRKTNDYRWAHSLCARLVPETAITFTPSDPYDLVDVCTLQSDRAKLKCVLCRGDPKIDHFGNGYPIQCSSKLCHVAFHPMCARAAGWTVDYSHQKAYCCKHTPEADITSNDSNGNEIGEEPKLKLRLNLNNNSSSLNNSGSSGSLSPSKSTKYPTVKIDKNCPLHVTRSGEKLRIPTLAPKVLIETVAKKKSIFDESGIPGKLRIKIVQRIAKYWAMKRESRRGTPLLKSLQLEPGWSQTDAMTKEAFARELEDKLELVKHLHSLKEKLKILREREIAKLRSSESSFEIFEILSSPFSKILEKFIDKLQREVDKPGYFAHPVPCDMFPDYPVIIQYPMDFSTMKRNLKSDLAGGSDQLFYPTLLHFYADLKLIWENARVYNTDTSVFYRAANRLEAVSKSLLKDILIKFKSFGIEGPFDILKLTDATIPRDRINFDTVNLPDPTPARFPKAPTTDLGNEDFVLKRRGRPPKRREDANASGSIDSIGSAEEESQKQKQEKRRGRPPKRKLSLDESEPASISEAKESKRNELGNLFWVKMKSGNWCPGEFFAESKRIPRRSDEKSVRLFDAFKTILSVPEDSLKPLTEDFEADLESLQLEGVVSKKFLASAHRQALSSLKQ